MAGAALASSLGVCFTDECCGARWAPACVIACSSRVQAEGFWSIYSHITRPNDLPQATDVHVFRCATTAARGGGVTVPRFSAGVLPVWEDPANARGGRATVRAQADTSVVVRRVGLTRGCVCGGGGQVRVKKGLASHMWEALVRPPLQRTLSG